MYEFKTATENRCLLKRFRITILRRQLVDASKNSDVHEDELTDAVVGILEKMKKSEDNVVSLIVSEQKYALGTQKSSDQEAAMMDKPRSECV